MKTFKEFSQQLVETTVPEELQHIPERWNHHINVSRDTVDKITDAMDGKFHTTFPLDSTIAVNPDPDVIEHLSNNGYKIKDYAKGIATTKKRVGTPELGYKDKHVDERIGSVLEKTKAPLHVKSAFINDSARAATKGDTSKQHVCITTTPLGIAGMSIGNAWENQSCMNLNSGSQRDYLKHDSENGTHVAYLVNHDDHGAFYHGEPDKPLARIALKPFHKNNVPEDDTIFRAEDRSYGASSALFSKAVNDWAEKHYPATPGETYHKNENVYDDTGNNEITPITNEQIKQHINDYATIPSNFTYSHENINTAISHAKKSVTTPFTNEQFINSVSRLGYLSNHHVHELNKMATGEHGSEKALRTLATRHGDKLSTNALNHYVNVTGADNLPNIVLMSKRLPDDVVDKLPANSLEYVQADKIKPHHIDKIVDSFGAQESGAGYPLAKFFNKTSKENLNDLIAGGYLRRAPGTSVLNITKHPLFDQDLHNKIVKNSSLLKNDENMDTLLSNSKFSKLSDIPSDSSPKHRNKLVQSLMRNDDLPIQEADKVKNDFIQAADSQYAHVRGPVASRFGPKDYETLVKQGRIVSFRDPVKSNHFLDAHEKLINHLDNQLDMTEKDSPEHDKLKDELHNRLERYSYNMDDHIMQHVAAHHEHSGDEIVGNYHEFDKTKDRLDNLDKLNHYNTPNNSNRYDDHEHWNDHFANLSDRLQTLHDTTVEHDNQEWD